MITQKDIAAVEKIEKTKLHNKFFAIVVFRCGGDGTISADYCRSDTMIPNHCGGYQPRVGESWLVRAIWEKPVGDSKRFLYVDPIHLLSPKTKAFEFVAGEIQDDGDPKRAIIISPDVPTGWILASWTSRRCHLVLDPQDGSPHERVLHRSDRVSDRPTFLVVPLPLTEEEKDQQRRVAEERHQMEERRRRAERDRVRKAPVAEEFGLVLA